MSEVYEKYFGMGDVSLGKAKMMRDIEMHRLSGQDLALLIDELERRNMLTHKHYTPKPKEQWDEAYLSKLCNGCISDYFSRQFLEHFGEAAEYVYSRKKAHNGKLVAAGVVLALLAFGLAFWCFSSNGNGSGPEQNNMDVQSSQN